LVELYRVAPLIDLEENSNFYVFDNISVDVDAEELNVVLSSNEQAPFDYKMKNLSRSSEHMYILSQTHYLSGYLISLQNSRSLLYLIYQVYKLGRNVSATLSLLSLGLERKVKCNNGYFINGYVFYTKEYE
jgi:hypothetical protein